MALTEAKKEVFGDASPLSALTKRRMSGREDRKWGSSATWITWEGRKGNRLIRRDSHDFIFIWSCQILYASANTEIASNRRNLKLVVISTEITACHSSAISNRLIPPFFCLIAEIKGGSSWRLRAPKSPNRLTLPRNRLTHWNRRRFPPKSSEVPSQSPSSSSSIHTEIARKRIDEEKTRRRVSRREKEIEKGARSLLEPNKGD